MGYLLDSIRALGATVKNIGRTPVTIEFPKQIRERTARYRTSFALIYDEQGEEKCVGCLACERICPSSIIRMASTKKESPVTGKKRGYLDDFTLDMTACIYCELCVQVCPFDAIVMLHVPEEPGFAREDLVLTMAKLYENGKNRPLTWADGTKLMTMQEPPKPAPAPAPAAVAAPTAAAAEPAAPPAAPTTTEAT